MTDQDNTEQPSFSGGDTTFISSTAGTRRTFLPGDIVDNTYQLTKRLGQGGMGVVFACRHTALGKDYALKLLNGDQLSGEYWTRFQAEAKALARLNHPGIVGIHNMGIDTGQYPYFVMDLLSGETLDSLLHKGGPLRKDQALDLFIQVSHALSSAHQQGIIHRDIKPSNLMLVRDELDLIVAIKIVDFGIARLSKLGLAAQSQTATGMVFGTPFYMSPEQCQGIRADERSDIYSLGCTLFEALTGSPPFCGDNAFQTFMLHQTQPPPSLASVAPNSKFEEAVENSIAKMLAKRPADRYQTMAQVKQDLERIRAGKPILSQGLSNTIAPGQGSAGPEITQRYSKTGRKSTGEQQAEEHRPALSKTKVTAIISTFALLSATACYVLLNCFKGPRTLTRSDTTISPAVINPGGHPADVDTLMDPKFLDFGDNENKLKPLLKAYIADPETARRRFKRNTDPPGFQFPQNFIIGAVRFGHDTPLMATGFIPIPPGKPVCLYLTNYTNTWTKILDKFGPYDLTGLEIVTKEPEATIETISHWKELKELAFFNSLTKALPHNEQKYDESALENKHLPLIDKLEDLQSLGLCGQKINGGEVLKMRLMDKLHTLKLKRIINLEPLLKTLSSKNNITELWLVGEDTTDVELEPLTRMKNLETLRIRRSNLTPASIEYFKKMPALKHLILDRDWMQDDMKKFKKLLPDFEVEPVIDFKYWQMFPDQKQ